MADPASAAKLSIILPSNRKPEPATVKCLTKLLDTSSMSLEPENYNSLYHVRNMAAARFLRSRREWSFWSDDDMIHPCGDAEWFKATIGKPDFPDMYAGQHAIYRMLVHKKT